MVDVSRSLVRRRCAQADTGTQHAGCACRAPEPVPSRHPSVCQATAGHPGRHTGPEATTFVPRACRPSARCEERFEANGGVMRRNRRGARIDGLVFSANFHRAFQGIKFTGKIGPVNSGLSHSCHRQAGHRRPPFLPFFFFCPRRSRPLRALTLVRPYPTTTSRPCTLRCPSGVQHERHGIS